MKLHRIFRWLLVIWVTIILFSPLGYWSTGIGQVAVGLSAEISRQSDGTLASSPKAEALHRLSLPMRLQSLILYPLLLLSFQFSGGSLALRRWIEGHLLPYLSHSLRFTFLPSRWRQRFSLSDLPVILFFVLAFNLALCLLYLPAGFYRSFIVGHQFGLSTQTGPGWFSDWGKSVTLTLILDGLSWTGLYALMRRLPRRWPIPAGALMIFCGGVLVLLTPILITPLFYKVHPLKNAEQQERILVLANRAGMQVDTVEVIEASAKTTEVNAYFTGFGGAQRIVLYDTLLRDYPPDQVEVVLAHEMGHWYYHHVLLEILGLSVAGWLGLFFLHWLLNRTWNWLGLHGPADIAGLPYVLAVIALATTLAMPLENGISRLAERQADQFALDTSRKPEAVIQLFKQFAVQNLSLVDAPAWEKFLFYTHPSLAERIGMAETFQKQQSQKDSPFFQP